MNRNDAWMVAWTTLVVALCLGVAGWLACRKPTRSEVVRVFEPREPNRMIIVEHAGAIFARSEVAASATCSRCGRAIVRDRGISNEVMLFDGEWNCRFDGCTRCLIREVEPIPIRGICGTAAAAGWGK